MFWSKQISLNLAFDYNDFIIYIYAMMKRKKMANVNYKILKKIKEWIYKKDFVKLM